MKKKMKNAEIDALHCGPPFGGGGSGGRPRLPIDIDIKPVTGKVTVISLPHACLAAGLFDDRMSQDVVLEWAVLAELCKERWDSSIERFFSDAEKIGITKTTADQSVSGLRGALIGWTGDNIINRGYSIGVCPDMNSVLGVLSRRVGDIFISSRAPEYTWDNLFGSPFEVDEDIFPAPVLSDEPWIKYRWNSSGENEKSSDI